MVSAKIGVVYAILLRPAISIVIVMANGGRNGAGGVASDHLLIGSCARCAARVTRDAPSNAAEKVTRIWRSGIKRRRGGSHHGVWRRRGIHLR